MANEPSAAREDVSDAPSEEDFQAFLATLSSSARGRAFLAEHARRSRSEGSATLLAAVQRLEGLVLSQTPPPAAENPTDELRGMIEAIRGIQAELDVGMLAAQVANLAALVQNLQARIETMATPAAAAPREELPPEARPEPEAYLAEPDAEPAPEPESPVPEIVEPESETALAELPEPEAISFDDSAPAEPVPEAIPEDAGTSIPEVAWCEGDRSADDTPREEEASPAATTIGEPPLEEAAAGETPAQNAIAEDAPVANEMPAAAPEATPPAGLAVSALVETLVVPSADDTGGASKGTVIKAGTIPQPTPFAGEDFTAAARPRSMPSVIDPLADVKALSDEERVALFT